MKENRYGIADVHYLSNSAICDTKTNNILVLYQICDLLNLQDKQIKELEKENQQLKQKIEDQEESYNNTMRYLNKTRSALLNLPKKIVEEIRKELKFVLSDFQCIFDTDKLVDSILKKYGGEYEN